MSSVKATALVFLVTSLLTVHGLASLGGSVSDIKCGQRSVGSTKQITDRGEYKIVQIDLDNGTTIKQYVNRAGLVFGITWQARTVPNLKPLLGAYFLEFQLAVQARGHRPGALTLSTKNLFVESAGHLRAFHGRACLLRLLPQQLTAAVLQ